MHTDKTVIFIDGPVCCGKTYFVNEMTKVLGFEPPVIPLGKMVVDTATAEEARVNTSYNKTKEVVNANLFRIFSNQILAIQKIRTELDKSEHGMVICDRSLLSWVVYNYHSALEEPVAHVEYGMLLRLMMIFYRQELVRILGGDTRVYMVNLSHDLHDDDAVKTTIERVAARAGSPVDPKWLAKCLELYRIYTPQTNLLYEYVFTGYSDEFEGFLKVTGLIDKKVINS